jgi:branched-chain amino acid transport system ATP-binding protein
VPASAVHFDGTPVGGRPAYELVAVIRRVHGTGVAIIWIEHIVHALRSVVSRLAVISAGRMLMDGAPDEVMASAEVQRVYLGIDVQ